MLLEKRILETGSRPQAGAKAQPPLLVDFVVTPGGFSRARFPPGANPWATSPLLVVNVAPDHTKSQEVGGLEGPNMML